MALRTIFWLALALIAASAAWRYRDTILNVGAPPPAAKKAFEFDNGTLREVPVPVSGAQAQKAPGSMRKCVRGKDIVYTNFACAAGYREAPVASDRVNVVPSTAANKPASPAAPGGAAESAGISALRDKLDIGHDARLREKAMERAVDAQGR